jgi:hypothetical protein
MTDQNSSEIAAGDDPLYAIIPWDRWTAGLAEIGNTWHHASFITDREMGYPSPMRVDGGIDAAHLDHQREWSRRTFGPGPRTLGVLDHIGKELDEIRADPTDLGEWVDVIILAFDGAWRHGWEPQQIIDAIKAKQAKNEARTWPDWRTMSADQAIEHDRTVQ